jgi:tetratricopeptide (TPR) repeat protein
LLYLQARALARRAGEAQDPSQKETQLREAWRINGLAERESPNGIFSRAGWLQRADLARRLGQETDARACEARAEEAPVLTTRDRFHLALDRLGGHHYREALALLQDVTKDDAQHAWAWFCQGVCHEQLGQDAEAIACYNACLALYPDSYEFHYNRGLVYQRQKRYVMAAFDFDEAIRLRPDRPEHHIARGVLHAERGEHKEAVAEFTTALDQGAPQTRVYFLRARSLDKLGDAKGAARDRAEGFRLTPTDEISWTARGIARLPKQPKEALADFDEALKLNPRYFAALQNKAHVLAEHLNRNEDALTVLDREVELYPDYVPGLLGRGVVRARLGQRPGAFEDAKAALDRDRSPGTFYQVANIYALTSRQVPEDSEIAMLNLSKALRNGYGTDLVDTDTDFDPVRELLEFKRIVQAAKQLRAAAQNREREGAVNPPIPPYK